MSRPAPNTFCASSDWPLGPFTKGTDRGLRRAAEFMGELASLIRLRRAQRHLSQRELAAVLGLSPGTITRLEAGSTWTHTAELLRICDYLDIPVRAPRLADLSEGDVGE